MKKLQVIELETGNVVKEYDVTEYSEQKLDKFEAGLLNRMDLDKYTVEVKES